MKQEIKDILIRFEQHGYEAYIVGGYVRDFLLGKISEDIDIATNATPDEVKRLFSGSQMSGEERFGNVNIKNVQITTFRKDCYTQGNRFPEVLYTTNRKEDVLRRDFTMNALYMDKDENIIDYVGGIHDIEKKVIRTIKNPKLSFEEDPLRMLRAIRFMKSLNFTLDSSLKKAMNEELYLLNTVSKKRIEREMNKGNTHFTIKDIELLLKK